MKKGLLLIIELGSKRPHRERKMKICRNVVFALVLLNLLCGSTLLAQGSSDSYMVNGHVSTWKEKSVQSETVWPSTDVTPETNRNTTYDSAPSRTPLERNAALPLYGSYADPLIQQQQEDTQKSDSEPTVEDEKLKRIEDGDKAGDGDKAEDGDPDVDLDDDNEIIAELEPEEPRQVAPETIDAINPMRHPMATLSIDVRDFHDEKPADESLKFTDQSIENWSTFAPQPATFAWAAPNIRYQPLYFENVPLERYGQTRSCLAEVAYGGIHFYRSLTLLPYHAAFDHPRSCDYPLGFCRPGNPTNKVRQFQWWGL